MSSFFFGTILQGALADIFLRGSNLIPDVQGMASLVCIPFFLVISLYILRVSLGAKVKMLPCDMVVMGCVPVINFDFYAQM